MRKRELMGPPEMQLAIQIPCCFHARPLLGRPNAKGAASDAIVSPDRTRDFEADHRRRRAGRFLKPAREVARLLILEIARGRIEAMGYPPTTVPSASTDIVRFSRWGARRPFRVGGGVRAVLAWL